MNFLTLVISDWSRRKPRLFFFSSRRRHTRFDCDWSSDVCSSDLKQHESRESNSIHVVLLTFFNGAGLQRSEERRVGKECRVRRSPGLIKKKGMEVKYMPETGEADVIA